MGMGSADLAASLGDLKKTGCQALATVVGNYLNSVYQAKCVIDNDLTSTTVDIMIDQSLSENAVGPGSSIGDPNCPTGASVIQDATISVKALSNVSATSQSAIASITKQGLKNTLSQLQSQKEGFQGTSTGADDITSMQTKLDNSSQDSNLNNAITNACDNISISQSTSYNALFGGTITNAPCVVDQDAYIHAQLASIISDAYSSTISTELSSFLSSAVSNSQTLTSEGAPNPMAIFKNQWVLMIIGGIALIAVAFFIMKMYKSKNTGKLGSSAIDMISKNPELLAFRTPKKMY
jgi:hypothetical protein